MGSEVISHIWIFRSKFSRTLSGRKLRLQTVNLWPDEAKLPGFKDTILKYIDVMANLSVDKKTPIEWLHMLINF